MTVHRSGEHVEVVGIRADDDIVAAKGSFNDRRVDDIGACGIGKEFTHAPRLMVVQFFDIAADEETWQMRLAAAAAPPLGHDRRWDGGHLA